MHVVHAIFKAFGGTSAIADKVNVPQQTASYWKTRTPPEIPPSQRLGVMLAAQSNSVELPADALKYLQSRDRTPPVAQC